MESVTFVLNCNGEPVKPKKYSPYETTLEQTLNRCGIRQQEKGKLIINTNPINPVQASLNNSFIGCLYDAYNNHHHVSLRPDDVWLTIVLTFANYVKHNSEEMRKDFVSYDGKKEIVISNDIFSGEMSLEDWSKAITVFCDKLDNKWIEPNFSTTTVKDTLIAKIALMGVMKKYLDFRGQQCCGIPQVTLMGTLQDWELLKTKLDFLLKYEREDLTWWHETLIPIIDQFINSYKGNPDENFWQSCANHIGGSSGPTFVSGWILVFSPFNKGKWRLEIPKTIKDTGKYGQINTDKFDSSATVEVPLKINNHDMCLYAGGIVNKYDENTNVITPSFDFAAFKMPPKNILISEHPHQLHFFTDYQENTCNVCNEEIYDGEYECKEPDCKYNYCFQCYQKTNDL